ncbi:MAG: hypothetical protein B7Y83_03685, partial [Flavobacteriales bacterium 32-34-25]
GHFAPELGGHFELESGGHFKLELGGQYHWNLQYSEEDDLTHIKWLIPIFQDSRYIKVNDRPVFVFYRPTAMPDIAKTLQVFREECEKQAVAKPYFIASNSHNIADLTKLGFDDIFNFQPQLSVLKGAFNDTATIGKWIANLKLGIFSSKLKVYNYRTAKQLMKKKLDYKYLPCVFVGWDNTARRNEKGIIIKGQNVIDFKEDVTDEITSLLKQQRLEQENFIFINAWNEWAEGNHLEPDSKNGLSYLQALKEIFEKHD